MEKNQLIYIVTAIEPDNYRSRAFGFFFTLNEAFDAVLQNHGNLHECLYDHVVIEKLGPGIHALCLREYWFRWNIKEKKWKTCDKPVFATGLINWGIG